MPTLQLQCGMLLCPIDANDSPKNSHTHSHTDLTGCRSTAWTDQQTRPAAAEVAKKPDCSPP